jgi:hypothetical protein
MKKLILATIACAFIATPALANDFATEQAKELGSIIKEMDTMEHNSPAMDFLTDKRNCVEKSTNLEELQACVTKFQPQHDEKVVKQ